MTHPDEVPQAAGRGQSSPSLPASNDKGRTSAGLAPSVQHALDLIGACPRASCGHAWHVLAEALEGAPPPSQSPVSVSDEDVERALVVWFADADFSIDPGARESVRPDMRRVLEDFAARALPRRSPSVEGGQ